MIVQTALQRLSGIAEDQWGLITRQQALLSGVDRKVFERLGDPGKSLIRVASGVYRMTGAPISEHLALKAAWLQLAPSTFAFQRTVVHGVISHRSAAEVMQLGHLAEQLMEFTLTTRRQTRRTDVRLHHLHVAEQDCFRFQGMLLTRPSRVAHDLLSQREDLGAVGYLIADALGKNLDQPGNMARQLQSHARHFGLELGDGIGLLQWALELVGDERMSGWLALAHDATRHSLKHEGERP